MSGRRKKKRPVHKPQKATDKGRLPKLVVGGLALAFCAVGLGLWFGGLWSKDAGPTPGSLNLVLVSVDTLRADRVSAYGEGAKTTPHIDRLSSEGVLFEQVVTTAPTTLAAHASLLTGLTPLRHFVHDNVGFRLPEEIPTLASILRQEGFRTGGFVGAFVLDSRFGIGRGFENYFDRFATTSGDFATERRGEAVLREALRWLEATKQEPFFAFLHFFDPHRPYDPPPSFYPRQPSDRALYEGEVAYVDSLIGRLMEWLDQQGLTDNTVVVVTADHGESLEEHGEETHGYFLYELTLHVPLVVRYPGGEGGKRIDDLVSIVDVTPTCLDLLGVAAPENLDGRSLLPLLNGAGTVSNQSVYSETFFPRLHFGWSELRSLRRGKHKLILAPRSELYDLEADPGESENLLESRPDLADEMREELEGILSEQGSSLPRAARLDESSLAALRSLGYVGGTVEPDIGASSMDLADPKDRLELYRKILDLSVLSDASAADEPRFQRASDSFRSILKEDPSNLRAHLLYGNLLLGSGRFGEAAKVYGNLRDLDPDNVHGHRGLARAQMALGQDEEAKKNLQRAIELDPESAQSYALSAELARKEGDLEEAEKWLRKALALSPDRFLYQELAEVLDDAGRGAQMDDVLSSGSLGSGRGDAAADYMHGERLFADGDVNGALVYLRRASGLAPEDDDVRQALGNALAASGDLQGAMIQYLAIVERSPCYVGAYLNLGSVYDRLGRLDEAAAAFENALQCDKNYAQAYGNLASVLARQGKLSRAVEALKAAVRLRPGDLELEKALEQLQAYEKSRR